MRRQRITNIVDACNDRQLFGQWFRDPVTWQPWLAFLSALFALPMTDEQRELYRRCTGRTDQPADAFSEAWLVCGRRAGKSYMLALIAVYLACFKNYAQHLGPGER